MHRFLSFVFIYLLSSTVLANTTVPWTLNFSGSSVLIEPEGKIIFHVNTYRGGDTVLRSDPVILHCSIWEEVVVMPGTSVRCDVSDDPHFGGADFLIENYVNGADGYYTYIN